LQLDAVGLGALVWSGERERAESYCVKLQVAGLQSTIEQDS
jgi:ATP-dependent Clp protease adapter protein ClpS